MSTFQGALGPLGQRFVAVGHGAQQHGQVHSGQQGPALRLRQLLGDVAGGGTPDIGLVLMQIADLRRILSRRAITSPPMRWTIRSRNMHDAFIVLTGGDQ